MISIWRLGSYLALWLFSVLVTVMGVMPPAMREKAPQWFPHKPVVLGLDLQGGVHLALEVDEPKLLGEQYRHMVPLFRQHLRQEKMRFKAMTSGEEGLGCTLLRPQGETYDLATKLESFFQHHDLVLGSPAQEPKITLVFTEKKQHELMKSAVEKSMEIIRRRVDASGTLEPSLQALGHGRIILQIPGFDDPKRVRALLGETAKLTFQWVYNGETPQPPAAWVSMDSFRYGGQVAPEDQRSLWVDPQVLLGGEEVADCRASYDHQGGAVVMLRFTPAGGRAFSHITQENVGRCLGIVLDEKVLSYPRINSHIPPGTDAFITNIPSLEEASRLSLLIRSGALPAPLKVLEEKVVGPGLGKDSIALGLHAAFWSVVSVVVFMLLAYSFFGIFAVLGVVCNIFLLMACLILGGVTLTLPGIAGIVLTMGMAVDANVLINERIKEELRQGKSFVLAIESGYKRAMSSIVDSNITTLIGSGILYMVGTGPVRGFAVTMTLGIIISFFTAVSLTKTLIFFWFQRWRPQKLWI